MKRYTLLIVSLALMFTMFAGCGSGNSEEHTNVSLAFLHNEQLMLGMNGRYLIDDLDMYVHWEQEDGMDYTHASTTGDFTVMGISFTKLSISLTDELVTRVSYETTSSEFDKDHESLLNHLVKAYGEHDFTMDTSDGYDALYWELSDKYLLAINAHSLDTESDPDAGISVGYIGISQLYYPNGRSA